MTFQIRVDVANPGQFFACCGLFELASRLDAEALAHFEPGRFVVAGECTLPALLATWTVASLRQDDPEDDTASPIEFGPPFDLRIDWWKDNDTGGRDLKVWAGTMQSVRIARAMIAALRDPALHTDALLDAGQVVYDPDEPTKKVEPFYFDARRTPNAHSRDVGFSPNDLELTTTAFPAVEALCLVGLQRFRPAKTGHRIFDYCTWPAPVPVSIGAVIVAGKVRVPDVRKYRFEAWFRTGQKKHKAFRAAVAVAELKESDHVHAEQTRFLS